MNFFLEESGNTSSPHDAPAWASESDQRSDSRTSDGSKMAVTSGIAFA
jgi:hypothetical protein